MIQGEIGTVRSYYLLGDLYRAVTEFVDHYNQRYHESLDNPGAS